MNVTDTFTHPISTQFTNSDLNIRLSILDLHNRSRAKYIHSIALVGRTMQLKAARARATVICLHLVQSRIHVEGAESAQTYLSSLIDAMARNTERLLSG